MKIACLTAILMTSLVWPTAAVTIESATFAPTLTVGDQQLTLKGAGLLKWKIFFKVYASALYLPSGAKTETALDDAPKQLVFHYFMDFDKGDFAKGAAPYLDKNLTKSQQASIAEQVKQINALYEDIKAGDRYTLTYIPGTGTELAKNGQPLGVIKGADFARYYFRIWLGKEPISTDLRDDLLNS